jgi:hypothetical protein
MNRQQEGPFCGIDCVASCAGFSETRSESARSATWKSAAEAVATDQGLLP